MRCSVHPSPYPRGVRNAVAVLAQDAAEDLEDAAQRAQGFFEDLYDAAPRVGIALGVVAVAWLVGWILKKVLTPRWSRRRTRSFGTVIPKLISYGILFVGVIAALTVAFPSVQPVDMLAGLGVVSVAAGFAFQDIFSNLLAGLLLIIRQPFVSGDQVTVGDHSGTVEEITIRETSIRTFDGHRVLIPNRDVYQGAVDIQTAFPSIRTTLVVGCSYDDDLDEARDVALRAVREVAGVLDEPSPEAFFTELGESTIDLDLQWWGDPHQREVYVVRDEVIRAVRRSFAEAGLQLPFPITTLDAAPRFERSVRPRDA